MTFPERLMHAVAAYPVAEARHRAWHAQAARWARRHWLTKAQLQTVQEAYPLTSYRPAWPIRFGLFLFGWVGLTVGGGTFLAFSGLLGEFNEAGGAFFALLLAGAALEASIRTKRCYHAGLDQAFLYAGLLAAAFLLTRVFNIRLFGFHLDHPRLLPLLLSWLLLALATVARYAEPGATIAAFLAYLLVIANLLLPYSWGRLVLPLAALAAAGAVAWLARAPPLVTAATYYYEKSRVVLRGLALLTMYLAVNYLIVREGNAALGNLYQSVHPPLGWLFVVFTAMLPVVYLTLGLRRADRLLLTLGFVTLAFSFYTLRTYHALLPLPVAATLVGVALLAVAIFGLRYLRPQRHGLTAVPDAADDHDEDASNPFRRENFEALASAQLTAPAEAPVASGPQTEFGGGHYGGGGASGDY